MDSPRVTRLVHRLIDPTCGALKMRSFSGCVGGVQLNDCPRVEPYKRGGVPNSRKYLV